MDTLQPGQMLGPYRIISQVGQGGMATVYKAYQASVDRYVAIKVLPGQLAQTPEFAARFQQEARIIAKLEHPHILPVFDYGESDGLTYFVMRYLDAGTLKDRMIEGRPLPLPEIDRIFTQLTDALSYAHAKGVVHRDLKPANALIDSQGNIFLTDFGIAKLLESASPRLTQTDAIMGTPAYISPEQAQGQPVDRRSDIYSLGIILYEMVTGSVPFTAETPLAVLFKHISDPLPPPSKVKPDLGKPIERVLLKALAKNPQDRFATATEFLEAWKRALQETETVHSPAETIPPPRTPPPSPPRKPAPAPRAASKSAMPTIGILGCAAAVCVLATIGGIGLFAMNSDLLASTDTPVPTATVVTDTPTNPPPPTATSTPIPMNMLLEDDFSDSSIWGTLDGVNSKVEYANNALHIQVFDPGYVAWTRPNDEHYDGVHLEVTVNHHDTDPTTIFGVICAQQQEAWSFYYLAIRPAGDYAIIKATDGEDDVYLTGDGWTTSSLIKPNAGSYRVGADCNGGTLTLYVDGQRITSITDNTYIKGRVGVFGWSGDRSADVTFDNFLLASLK